MAGFEVPGALVPVGQPAGARAGGAVLRGAVDGARAARARAEHAGEDGGRAGAGGASASCSWCSAARRSDGGALVSPWWLVAAYTFHTFGELCLSPIGLSFVTKLAPVEDASRC